MKSKKSCVFKTLALRLRRKCDRHRHTDKQPCKKTKQNKTRTRSCIQEIKKKKKNTKKQMIKSKMLGPVYKYNIPYKMASGYMYKTKLRG